MEDNNTSKQSSLGNSTNTTQIRPRCWEDTKGYIERTTFALFCVESVLIILLNALVIKSTIERGRWKSRMYFFLLHLAIADLFVGVFLTFPKVIEEIAGKWMTIGDTDWLCKMVKYLGFTSLYASIYILTAMSIDRALVVVNPLKNFNKGRMTQMVTVAFCWVFALLLNIPVGMYYIIQQFRGRSFCWMYVPGENSQYWRRVMAWGNFVMEFALPSAVIIASFSVLLCVLYRRSSGNSCLRGNSALARPSVGIFNSGLPRTKIKSIKLTFGIVLTYIICWLPRYIFRIGQLTAAFPCSPWSILMVAFIYLNNIANPTLFFVFHYHGKRKPDRMTSRQTDNSNALLKSASNKTVMALQEGEIGTGSTRSRTCSSSVQSTHMD